MGLKVIRGNEKSWIYKESKFHKENPIKKSAPISRLLCEYYGT